MPRLFERFYRVEGARGRTQEGSGIGLALVRELVRLHCGEVRAESEFGKGSVFVVTVPLGKSHLSSSQIGAAGTAVSNLLGAAPFVEEALRWLPDSTASSSSHGTMGGESFAHGKTGQGARVLVADDNADMRDYLRRLLAARYEVTAVASGLEALAAIQQQPPDLVLSDVMMPGLDGFGLLKHLRADPGTSEIPFLLLSARAGEEARVEGLEAGADDYLTKPFSTRELLARVGANLELAKLRREAAATLRQSEQRFRGIMESITDAFFAVDSDWKFTYVNPQAERLIDRKSGDLLGRLLWEEFPGLVGSDFERAYRRVATERVTEWLTAYYPDHKRWYEVHVYPATDGISIFFQNVTERKQAEAELIRVTQASEQQRRIYETALSNTPDFNYVFDLQGRFIYINKALLALWGKELHEALGKNFFELGYPPALAERLQGQIQTVIETQQPLTDETSYTSAAGERQYEYIFVAVQGAGGAVEAVVGSTRDITERKRDEESSRYLAAASASLASVVDYESTLRKVANLAVPFFADWAAVDVVNDDGSLRRLAVAHQETEKIRLVYDLMREYPPDPQAPRGVYAVVRSGKPEIVQEITDDLLVQGAKDERHLKLIRSLGLRSFICVPLIVSGNTFGALTFATAESGRKYTDADVALAKDLAQRAGVAIENTQLYQALRDNDRRKDEFLATLAHELRNPLAPIRNSLQILKMPRVDAATIERSREMMERQVQQLVRLVDDLLDVSRVMRGKIELRKERVELATVIARAVETVQPLIEAQQHELTVEVPADSLPLDADPVRLAQVVGNLLTNAAKYTEAGGRIRLTAQRAGSEAVLRVSDTGIGIASDMLPHIFELFVQVDHAATRAQGGLGIGLTLVKNLVEMHHGTVEAHSGGLGKGSEFVVRLPLAAIAVDDSGGQVKEEHVRASSGRRLLVVDDNRDAAESLAMLLRLQGHEVEVAHDGPAALKLAAGYRPELVFLDIGMPGMDGYEAARRMRQQPGLENIRLAALTGWGQQEDRRRTAEAGFDHHVVKPVEPSALEELLARLKC
jgi:PAS domain S-box-containing protein